MSRPRSDARAQARPRLRARALRLLAVPLVLVGVTVAAPLARSYVPIVDTMGNYFHWRINPVSYAISATGEDSLTGENTEITAGFDAWENLVEAYIDFTQTGTSAANVVADDGLNIVSFDDPAGDQGPGVLATTYSSFAGPIVAKTGGSFGRILEADIAFNNGVDFITNAGASSGPCFGEVDMRGVVTHEIGHFIGLDHTTVPGATMQAALGSCDPSAASLSSDDIDGAAFLYPTGMMSGPPTADFTGSPLTGTVGTVVSFTDLSVGSVTTWAWNFGDGTTSTATDPAHTYVAPGTYTVVLTVTGIAGSDTETKTAYVVITPGMASITADFSGGPRMGNAPLTVSFSDLSSPTPSAWVWDFGGAGTNTLQNPTQVFTAPGCYDVLLTVMSSGGATDSELKTCYINVSAGSGPAVADFSGAPTTGLAPLTVAFTDLSSGAVDSWSWDFGDGFGSTSNAPTHLYQVPGSYAVSLAVAGPGGTSTETKTGYIEVVEPGGGPVADFVAEPLQGTAPFSTRFRDFSTGEIDSRVWNFGQGEVTIASTDFGVMFPEPGYYDVTLTVSGSGGADTLTKANYIVVLNPDGTLPPNPDQPAGIGDCACGVVGAGDNGFRGTTLGMLLVGLGLSTATVGLRRRRRR
ncbi:MAG TPA: PKD domain-containing protein [Myxococcota bacterium]|jgi:PKD repeat protein|nr:PKD domain-containing protein [Myxococcota bacterium]